MTNYIATSSDLTSVADAIRAKGSTSSPLVFPSEFVSAIDAIQTGGSSEPEEKDINFIDYDGTLLYTYTTTEALTLTELPTPPAHEGLVSEGWNWTLEHIKEYINDGCTYMVIGALYHSQSGNLEFHLNIPYPVTLYFNVSVSAGDITFNWGDGNSNTYTETGSSTVSYSHEYTAGKYVVGVSKTMSSCSFMAQTNGGFIHANNTANSNRLSKIYMSFLEKMVFGTTRFNEIQQNFMTNVVIIASNYMPLAFAPMKSGAYNYPKCCIYTDDSLYSNDTSNYPYLKYVSTAYKAGSNNVYLTYGHSCKSLTFPKYYGDAVISGTLSANQYLTKNIFYPSAYTKLPSTSGSQIYNITVKENISTSSNMPAFNYGTKEIHFKGTTPPQAGTSTFSNIASDCKIYVPTGYLTAYTSASNYPSSSTYSYIEE